MVANSLKSCSKRLSSDCDQKIVNTYPYRTAEQAAE